MMSNKQDTVSVSPGIGGVCHVRIQNRVGQLHREEASRALLGIQADRA